MSSGAERRSLNQMAGEVDMYFTVGRLLFIWVWRVKDLRAWGFALTKAKAKQAARQRILLVRPDASESIRV